MEWQPIETAPKDETPILVVEDSGFMFVAYWDFDQWTSVACNEDFFASTRATHWMPLPEPPK